MNDSKVAAKLRAQLKRFLGELLPHFSKPKTGFLGDMIYGLMAGGDVKLSEICRACRPTITMKKAGDRLCMHLRFWSPESPGFTSENDELEAVFEIIIEATGGRGIFIYDRGGDNIEFYRYFLRKNVDFIVRLKSRYVISWKQKLMCEDLARQCVMRYTDTITFDSHGKKSTVELNYGVVPVRLPDIGDKLLHMVVIRGFGQKPMMLLTTLARTTARKDLWQVVTAYITRWRIEETIRHVKQSYNLEDIRLLRYNHLKNMAAIVLAAAYFCMTWIGSSDKLALLAKSITDASLRIHELPDFHFYAIADGIRMLLSRCGRWSGFGKEDIDDEPNLFKFFNCDS